MLDEHTIELTDSKGGKEQVTSEKILIAVGGRPNYSEVEGAKEFCITSDDLFSLKKSPGKTLVVGASYIALECGGFLNSLGYETSIMVRSILLRGFDQGCANKIGNHMQKKGVQFIRQSVPTKYSRSENGRILVNYHDSVEKSDKAEEFDTVLLAVGRSADTQNILPDNSNVKLSKWGKVIVNEAEQSSVENIFAIGDCTEGRPELTPVAIFAGKLLARRLFQKEGKTFLMDYRNVATTIFTPIEYGTVGYSEEDAIKSFGKENIISYHSAFAPPEWCFTDENTDECYIKIVVTKDDDKVVGFHIVSPYAGEITQGISVAMKAGMTKEHLDNTVAIHPTIAEEMTMLKSTTEEELKASRGCANGKCG